MNGVEAASSELPAYEGGANAVEAASSDLPAYEGGANAVEAAVHEFPAFAGGVNGAEATVHEVPEYKGDQSIVTQAMSQGHTYQAPAAHQHLLPETGSEDIAPLASVGFVGMLLGMFVMGKKKED